MPVVIGVDVGGTNTDAAAIDLSLSETRPADSIIAHCKTPTTPDTSDGISQALREILSQLPLSAREDITAVNIGTTHFINAVVEHDVTKLAKVAVLRLCGPYAREVPPFAGLPDDLRLLVEGFSASLPGGLEIDGRVITPVDEDAVKKAAEDIRAAGLKNVAVIGTYSPIDSVLKQEEHVRHLLRSALGPDVNITLSHNVAGIGFIERENATVLNATILPFAQRTIRQFKRSLRGLKLSATLYLTKNDGTLISADDAANLPVSTFISGPTNSLTGAAFLASGTGVPSQGALVLDIGGTTSDVCALEASGLPRPAAAISHLAGVRTNFAVPDVRSIGVGGGSLVQVDAGSGAVAVGPQSVGKRLPSEARVFGGPSLTATDVVVAAGGLPGGDIGDRARVADVPAAVVAEARRQIKAALERVIDEMKTSEADVPVILVGGGSILCPDGLRGVSEILRPAFSQVANAVGAAMAKVAGVCDTIVNLADGDDKAEQAAVAGARAEALRQALRNGAESPEVVEETVLPVPYVSTRSRHIVVRSAGRLSMAHRKAAATPSDVVDDDEAADEEEVPTATKADAVAVPPTAQQPTDLASYRPTVQNNRWVLSPTDLDFIADGCAILGCGGGGDTYASYLSVSKTLSRPGAGTIEVISSSSLPDAGIIPAVAVMGSPSTFSERLPSGTELPASITAVLQAQSLTPADLTAVMSLEIGGSNGLRGLQAALWAGRPLVDADLMGRAYPNLWQVTPHNAGVALAPAAASDAKGNTVLHARAGSNADVEDVLRAVCVRMGQAAGVSLGALTGAQVKRYAAQRSFSLAWRVGRAVRLARAGKRDVVGAVLEEYPGKRILTGKVTRVSRDVRGAFTEGEIEIVPFAGEAGGPAGGEEADPGAVRITFQNENIHAYEPATGRTLASVPDLICVLDAEDGRALGTQDYRYGLRVHVLALVGSPQWTQGEGLKNGGPEAFGLPIEYVPAATFREPVSVIDEYKST